MAEAEVRPEDLFFHRYLNMEDVKRRRAERAERKQEARRSRGGTCVSP